MVDANIEQRLSKIEERGERIERLLTRGQRETRRDLGLLAIQAQLTDLGVTAMLCAGCVGVVGAVFVGAQMRESAKENMPAWAYNMIWGWAGDTAVNGSGEYASPIVGKSLQDLVDYKPSFGQSFGPETGNQRSYGPHGGVDFDCRVGGCAGADIASPIAGTVISIRQIGTSVNGGSFQVDIDGEDWGGLVTHQLVHIDSISVKLGDEVKAGQIIAKVSPTDTVSTGPHFDWKIRRNGKWQNPQAWAAKAIEQSSKSSDGGDFVDRYMKRVANKESDGNYGAVNTSHPDPNKQALGKYQFMPETLVSTAEKCIGRAPSRSEFLGSPKMQEKIMRCYISYALPTVQQQSSDPYTQCRMMAAFHYSGSIHKYNDTSPQSWGGDSYPSINAYTQDVCKGF
jgi:hypothetical protein